MTPNPPLPSAADCARPALALALLLAALTGLACTRGFELPPPPPAASDAGLLPPPSSIALSGTDASEPLRVFSRERVRLTGKDFTHDLAVTFNPGAVPGRVLEVTDAAAVVEVPDLGTVGSRTVTVSNSRGTGDATPKVVYLGPGQPRIGRTSAPKSLVSVPHQFVQIPLAGPRSTSAPDGGTTDAGTGDDAGKPSLLARIEEIQSDVLFTSAVSDFSSVISVRSNFVTGAVEFPRPIVAVAPAVLPFEFEVDDHKFVLGVVAALDWNGEVHVKRGGFVKIKPDFGWAFGVGPSSSPSRKVFGLNLTRGFEARAAVLPARPGHPAELGRLLVLARKERSELPEEKGAPCDDSTGAALALVPIVCSDKTCSAGAPLCKGLASHAGEKAHGALDLIVSGERVFLTGVTIPGAPDARRIWELDVASSTQTIALLPVKVSADDGGAAVPLEDAVAYRSKDGSQKPIAVISFAASPDGARLAVSFMDESLPRLAVFERSSPKVNPRLVATSASAHLLHSLTFVKGPTGDALYALDALTPQLLRIGLADGRVAAGFPWPGGPGASRVLTLGATGDGRRLFAADFENGSLLQFSTLAEAFLPPIQSIFRFGSIANIELNPEKFAHVVFNHGPGASHGRFVLPDIEPDFTAVLGAGNSGPGFSFTRRGRDAATQTEIWTTTVVSGGGAQPVTADDDSPVRVTRVSVGRSIAGALAVESRTCPPFGPGAREPRAFALDRSSGALLALVSSDTSAELLRMNDAVGRLLARPDAAEFAEPFCQELAKAPALWSAATKEGKPFRQGGLTLSPSGWAAFGLASIPDLFVLSPRGQVERVRVPPKYPNKDPNTPLDVVAAAIDDHACTETFKPALFALAVPHLRRSGGDDDHYGAVAALGLHESGQKDGALCAPRTPKPKHLATLSDAGLDRAVGIAVSPNGRRLLVIADRGGTRWLSELDVERDAVGEVTAVVPVREVRLGEAAPDDDKEARLTGFSFSSDGAEVLVTVPKENRVVTYQ